MGPELCTLHGTKIVGAPWEGALREELYPVGMWADGVCGFTNSSSSILAVWSSDCITHFENLDCCCNDSGCLGRREWRMLNIVLKRRAINASKRRR